MIKIVEGRLRSSRDDRQRVIRLRIYNTLKNKENISKQLFKTLLSA